MTRLMLTDKVFRTSRAATLAVMIVALLLPAMASAELVVHYQFEGTDPTNEPDLANADSTATPDDSGTLENGITRIAGGSPVNGGSQSLGGATGTQQINIGANQDYLQNVPGATVASWIKVSEAALNGAQHFLNISTGQASSRLHLQVRGTNAASGSVGTLASFMRRTNGDSGGTSSLLSDGQIPFDKWTHVALVADFENPNSTTFYIDGTDVGLDAALSNLKWTSGNSENNVTPVNMVSNQGGSTNAFPGLMDDFRVYNHALSASEIGALVPEPSSVALLGLGLSILATRYRRRRSK